jgi:phage internal scaffolding protein
MNYKTKYDVPPKSPVQAGNRSKTQQQYRDRTDIKNIMGTYQRGGRLPIQSGSPMYGDFSEVGTYQQCLERVRAVQSEFENLPSGVRKRFRNNPAELIDFVMNEENREEAEKIGLIEKVVEPREAPEEPEAKPKTKQKTKQNLSKNDAKNEGESE